MPIVPSANPIVIGAGRMNSCGTADMGMQWTADHVTLMNLFQVKYEQTEHNDYFSSSSTTTKEYEEETSGLGLRHHARFGNTLIQIGGQVSNSTGFGPNLSKGDNKYDTTVMGWSVSLEQKLLDGDLIFDGGFRQDTKHIDHSSSGRTESAAVDEANNDVELAPADIFALGTHWQITDIYAFDGRYYQGEQGTVGDFDMRLEDDAEPHPERQDRTEISLSADYASFFKPAVTWFN